MAPDNEPGLAAALPPAAGGRPRRSLPRLSRPRALLLFAAAAVALAGFRGAEVLTPTGGSDAQNYLAYASYLSDYHRLPPAALNPSQYSTPPLYEGLSGALNWIGHHLPSTKIKLHSDLLTGLAWLAMVAASLGALTAARSRLRLAGSLGLLAAAAWAAEEALTLGKLQHFSEGQLLSLACLVGLVSVTALLARELWPEQPRRAIAAAAIALAYPIVFRMGVMFHPEMSLAFACALAFLLVVRAQRRGWPWRLGLAVGATLGIAADVRQSSVIVILSVGLAVALAGGRRALRFFAAAALCLALVAGPWWAYATIKWGSPLKLALIHTGEPRLKGNEPFSFFVSFPLRTLVTHPYRPDFANQLLPMVHADLWSDWYGNFLRNQWVGQSHLARLTASTQSVLGFVGDGLGLLGLLALGLPSALRLARRRPRDTSDFAAGFLALLTVAAFLAFVLTILRYPQADGKEIKASYLLFTTPCWALFALEGWLRVAGRSTLARRGLLPGFAALYAISYTATLYVSLS